MSDAGAAGESRKPCCGSPSKATMKRLIFFELLMQKPRRQPMEEKMKGHGRYSVCSVLSICFFVIVEPSMASTTLLHRGAFGDSLKPRPIHGNLPTGDSTLKLLPKYRLGKDSAGIQYIPTRIKLNPVIVRDINIAPYDKGPQIVKVAEPIYPDAARRANIVGTVDVDIVVDESGKVKQVEVSHSDYEILNEPALEAAKKFVLEPAYRNRIPVMARFSYSFHFGPAKKERVPPK